MVCVPLVAAGFSPLDEELGLLPGSLTPVLQEALVRLGAWMPFEQAGAAYVTLQEHEEKPEMREALAYLDKRESQMQYGRFTKQGWPIGSGAIESANKLVVEARLKGAGMHWARGHVNPMLALRNIVCSDRWQKIWPQIETHLREQAAQDRRKRRQANQREQSLAESTCKPTVMPARGQTSVKSNKERKVEPSSGSFTARGRYRPSPNHPWRHSPFGRAQYKPLSNSAFTKN